MVFSSFALEESHYSGIYCTFRALVKALLAAGATKRIYPKCMGPLVGPGEGGDEACPPGGAAGSWHSEIAALSLSLFPVSPSGLPYVCLSVCPATFIAFIA